MLYLTVTGRQDYVSNMPRDNRSFFYPSVSAGFILTELEELKNDVVNYAKLRVSYAEVGQAGDFLENYYSTPTYGGGFYSLNPIMYPIKGTTAYTPYYTIFDPNLKPQNTVVKFIPTRMKSHWASTRSALRISTGISLSTGQRLTTM